jgi:cytochrome P450
VSSVLDEIVLNTYSDVRAALNNRDLTRSLDPEKYEIGNITEGTLSILHGNEHRDRRRVENQLFRRSTLESYERVLFPEIVASTLGGFVDSAAGDLMEIGGLLTVVLAARTAGVDFDLNSFEQRQKLREYLHIFSVGNAIDAARGDLEEIKARMRITLAAFDTEFVRASWARREGLVARFVAGGVPEADLPTDVLTTLLRARATGELEMDDPQLLREVAKFFIAGAHTSTQTLNSTLHQLFDWCPAHPEDWSRLATDLYFVQRSVQEALRCRPTNPMIHRRAPVGTAVGGHDVAAGTVLLLDTIAANTDTDAYGLDAAEFNPHRRAPKDLAPWGMSFGHGMHLCIGRTLSVGMPVRADDVEPGPDHLYGLVPQAVQALVRRGVQRDPDNPPQRDTQTERWTRWAHYPVIFDPRLAAGPAVGDPAHPRA